MIMLATGLPPLNGKEIGWLLLVIGMFFLAVAPVVIPVIIGHIDEQKQKDIEKLAETMVEQEPQDIQNTDFNTSDL